MPLRSMMIFVILFNLNHNESERTITCVSLKHTTNYGPNMDLKGSPYPPFPGDLIKTQTAPGTRNSTDQYPRAVCKSLYTLKTKIKKREIIPFRLT